MMILIGFNGAVASDPRYLSNLLIPCRQGPACGAKEAQRPKPWSWHRIITTTAPIWEKP
jgi:hypothetical protein